MLDDTILPHVLALCRIIQATTPERIDNDLGGIVANSGFGGYCVTVIPDGPVISEVFVTLSGGNLKPLVDLHAGNGLLSDGPLIRAAAHLSQPIRWSEYLAAAGGTGGQRLRAVLDDAVIADGLTIPASVVNGRCRTLLSVSAPAEMDLQAFDKTVSQARPLLQLTALILGHSSVATRIAAAVLSNSEALVLAALAEGMRPREIALKLGKSEHTVRNQIVSAQQRLGARTKEQALVMAIRLGLISI